MELYNFTEPEDCPKCETTFWTSVTLTPQLLHFTVEYIKPVADLPEYLRCECQRCGWTWNMKCADAEEEDTETES